MLPSPCVFSDSAISCKIHKIEWAILIESRLCYLFTTCVNANFNHPRFFGGFASNKISRKCPCTCTKVSQFINYIRGNKKKIKKFVLFIRSCNTNLSFSLWSSFSEMQGILAFRLPHWQLKKKTGCFTSLTRSVGSHDYYRWSLVAGGALRARLQFSLALAK